MNRALWVVQGPLSALFLFGGVAKLTMPIDEIAEMMSLPAWFIVFIAVAEVAGGLGLILPGLTPLAASGLVIIMIGATTLTAAGVGGDDPVAALFPLVTGILAAFVAYGRRYLAPFRRPIRTLPRRRVLQHVA